MSSEYVLITHGEAVESQGHLLQAQLEILRTLKQFQSYKDLRKEQYMLKIALKQKIAEMISLLDDLQKSLPKSDYLLPAMPSAPKLQLSKHETTLDREISMIREKLERLQRDADEE